MNILIFGGNRFSGKLIVKKLFFEGHNITVLNRSGKSSVDCTVLKCDRNNFIKLSALIENMQFDCVIDMCLFNKQQAVESYILFNGKIKKYIFISSVAVYNENNSFPIKETDELGSWKMFGEYGLNKKEVEQYFEQQKDFPYVTFRPTYIIGENNHLNREGYYFENILKNKKINIEGDGNAILSFVFVEDVAEIICKATINQINTRESYNICNDEHITIIGFVELIAKILNKKVYFNYMNELVSFKNKNCFFSNKKIKKDFDHEFINLKPGLKSLSKFFLNKKLT